MEIKVTEKTKRLVKWALEKAAKMFAGDVGNSVDEICHGLCLVPLHYMNDEFKEELNKIATGGSKTFSETELAEEISETLFTNDFVEDKDHLKLTATMLDLVIRMAAGQWNMLYHIRSTTEEGGLFFSREDREKLDKLKDEYFGVNYYTGINCPELSDDVRVIYDFYKVWMYEMGVGGVYAYDVYPLSRETLPIVEFTPIKSWYIEKSEDVDTLYNELTEAEKKNTYEDGYFKVSNYVSVIPRPGETLILKKNGMFKVVEGKLKTEN